MLDCAKQAGGVWSTALGPEADVSPLGVVAAPPRREELAQMGDAPFPFAPNAVRLESLPGKSIVRLPLDSDERLFGLGLQFMRVNHRGRTHYLKMTSDLFHRHDRRTYGLVRASGAGASRLPYVLYSDLYDHRQLVVALCNASFCGLLWTPEALSAKSADEWVRRRYWA